MSNFEVQLREKCREVMKYGEIMTDISVPSVNSRFLNIRYNDTIYFIRIMDGNFMTLQDLNAIYPVHTVYTR